MRRDIKYRMYVNNRAATREQLDRIESITVEQEIDMAWEARLEIPVCVDGRGRWQNSDEPFMRPFTRVRIEICVRDDNFVPLIDGPIVEVNSRMHFEPGQSTVTVTVRDDSVFLHKNEDRFSFDDASDYEIVEEIFSRFEQIAGTDIDDDMQESGEEAPSLRANGTAMQVLMSLARVHGKHVYVLPGENPGESIGCCKALPGPHDRQTDRLPAMILLGPEANTRDLNVGLDFTRPARFSTAGVQASDKTVTPETATYQDYETLGDTSALPAGQEPGQRLLRPSPFEGRHRDLAATARAQRSSFAFQTNGSVIEGCYPGVLQPYRLVTVQAGETPRSGNWIIRHVTHTLGRSSYGQSFTLMRNAESETGGASLASMARGVF